MKNTKFPRCAVFRSNKNFSAQIIDDTKGKTLLAISAKENKTTKKITKTEAAYELGLKFGKILVEKKINNIVFDRRWYRYHGQVKKFAEGMRKSGVKF
jgi:large subunit ribosomal protein L18